VDAPPPAIHSSIFTDNNVSEDNATDDLSVAPLLTRPTNNATTNSTFLLTGENNAPVFVEILYGSGLGSVLIHLFRTALYLKETEGRDMIALDYLYGRYNRGPLGVLRGWFAPQFPVIDTAKESLNIRPYTNNFTYRYVPHTNPLHHCKDWVDGPVRLSCHYDYGYKEIRRYFNVSMNSTALYRPMVDKMCPHLQFNTHAVKKMDTFRKQRGVPLFDRHRHNNSGTTVTFHVRRTDKIKHGESDLYTGEDYVTRLLQVAPNVTFDTCFVATDSAQAVAEVYAALRAHDIQCDFYSFAKEMSVSKDETLQFLSELSYMINATYFVGTFSSNVGGLVGILRACGAEDKPLDTFANSYGVDSDTWYLR
jgi:hypothetical protein